jgi:hypothetical protein
MKYDGHLIENRAYQYGLQNCYLEVKHFKALNTNYIYYTLKYHHHTFSYNTRTHLYAYNNNDDTKNCKAIYSYLSYAYGPQWIWK